MLKRKLRENRGATLVELVVTFALVAILSVAVVTMVVLSAGSFESVSERGRSQTVGQLLLDELAAELGAAQPGAAKEDGLTISDGTGDFAYGACVRFCGSDGGRVYITARNGGLVYHYYPLTDGTTEQEATERSYPAEAYNGFTVPENGVQFELIGKNVLHVTLQLQSSKTAYAYTAERYIRCESFLDSVSQSKLGYGSISGN